MAVPTGQKSLAQINSEVTSVNSESLNTLTNNAIAYTGGNSTVVTNNLSATPNSMDEFSGYVHTQTQGLTYTQNRRHSTNASNPAFQQSSADVYCIMGHNLTRYNIKINWSTTTGKYTIYGQKVTGTTTTYSTSGSGSSVGTSLFTIGTVQVPSPYTTNNVDQIKLNHSQTTWNTAYFDMFVNTDFLTISNHTYPTPDSFITANGNSVNYGVSHRYDGQKEEGFSSSHQRTDYWSLTFRRSGYYDYTTPTFGVKTIHTYVRQCGGGFSCLHEDMKVWLKGKNNLDFTPVKEVKVGDMVRTKDGQYTKVTKVITDHMREGYYTLLDGLKITGDHPIVPHRYENEITPELPWVRVDECNLPKEYIEGPVPTVYIETEAGHMHTYWQQPNSNDRWEACLVSANYAHDRS